LDLTAIRHPGDRRVVYQRNGPQVVWFSEAYRNLQKVLDGFFPGLVVRIPRQRRCGENLSRFHLLRPPAGRLQLVNMETHTAGLIKRSSPWIDPSRMQAMNIIRFKTRDGIRFDALPDHAGGGRPNRIRRRWWSCRTRTPCARHWALTGRRNSSPARLRRAATELPRIDRIWLDVHGGRGMGLPRNA